MTSEPGKQCTQQAHEQMHQPGHTSIPRTVSEGPHSSFLAEMADSPSNARTNRAIHIIACLVVSGLKSNQLQQAVDSMRSHTARVPVNCEPIVDVTNTGKYNNCLAMDVMSAPILCHATTELVAPNGIPWWKATHGSPAKMYATPAAHLCDSLIGTRRKAESTSAFHNHGAAPTSLLCILMAASKSSR